MVRSGEREGCWGGEEGDKRGHWQRREERGMERATRRVGEETWRADWQGIEGRGLGRA